MLAGAPMETVAGSPLVWNGIIYEAHRQTISHMKHENNQIALVKALTEGLTKSHAHASLEEALKGLPADLRGVVPEGLPYSIWQLVEHIRITQWDIVEFSTNPGHESPQWPEGYWPKEHKPHSEKAWTDTLHKITRDRDTFIQALSSGDADLYTPFPYGDGQNLLREAILLIDHTSYHVGEILVLRRLLGTWKS